MASSHTINYMVTNMEEEEKKQGTPDSGLFCKQILNRYIE
jgi:hypothetical protein